MIISASATDPRSNRTAKRGHTTALLASLLLITLMGWHGHARAVFPLTPPKSDDVRVPVPLVFVTGEFLYVCGDGNIRAVDIRAEEGGIFLVTGTMVLPNGTRLPAKVLRKYGWEIPLAIDQESNVGAVFIRKTSIHSNFKANESFYTGTRYFLVQEQRYSDGSSPAIFESEFWFEKTTVDVPGRGRIDAFTATTLFGAKLVEMYRFSFDPSTKKIVRFFSVTKGERKARACWLKDKS